MLIYFIFQQIFPRFHLLFTYPEILFLIAAGVMAPGVSFYKVNIASFINLFYKEESSLLDSTFSIFYLFINLGLVISPLLINYVVGIHHTKLYQYGFLIGAITIFIALLFFYLEKNKYFVSTKGEPLDNKPIFKNPESSEYKNDNTSKISFNSLIVIIAILFSAFIFQIFYQQSFSSQILFAENHVHNVIPFINQEVTPSFYLTLNPLFIILLSPLYIKLFNSRSRKNKEIYSVTKIGIGLLLLGISY